MSEFITIGNIRFSKSQIEAYGIQTMPTYNYPININQADKTRPVQEVLRICIKERKDDFYISSGDSVDVHEVLQYLDTNMI